MCLAISEAILTQRIGHHRRICIGYAGNLFPEEAHGHLKVTLATTRSLREFLSGRICTSLTASWIRPKRVCSSAPSKQLGDAAKIFQKPALFAHALLGSGHLSLSLIQRPAKSGVAATQVAQTLCRSLNLRPYLLSVGSRRGCTGRRRVGGRHPVSWDFFVP